MDLIRYIKFYYFNENPEWFVQRASFYHPKPLADIMTDIGINICFFITFVIVIKLSIYGARYFLNMRRKNKQESKNKADEDKQENENEEKVEDQTEANNEFLAHGEGEVLFEDIPETEDKPEERGDVSPRAN